MDAFRALLLGLCVAALPGAAAQHAHAEGATAFIAHDTPANGRTLVGTPTGFAVVKDADADLRPDVHQDNRIRVVHNGATLWETSAAAGHDYDGVNTFSVVFPTPGPYAVETLDGEGKTLARFEGFAELPYSPVTATGILHGPASVPALQPADFTFSLQAGAGQAILPHSDALFEVREGADLVFRTRIHTHTDPMRLSYAFPHAGTYAVRVAGHLAFAPGTAPEFMPVFVEKTVEVTDPAAPSATPAPSPPSPLPSNAVIAGTTRGGPHLLFGTYDPYTMVGPGTQLHLAALVMDPATGRSVQHVDFKATLVGPHGVVFSSASLHEYDGIYELVTKQQVPGAYRLDVEATRDGWAGQVGLPFTVAVARSPPIFGLGPVALSLDAPPLKAGTSGTMALAAKDAAGQPYPHSEVDVELRDAGGQSLLRTKLHTHADGLFLLTYAFPAGGNYTLRVAPTALDGAPATYLGGPLSAATDFVLQVAPGALLPQEAELDSEPVQQASASGLLGLGAIGLALLACARRRLRR